MFCGWPIPWSQRFPNATSQATKFAEGVQFWGNDPGTSNSSDEPLKKAPDHGTPGNQCFVSFIRTIRFQLKLGGMKLGGRNIDDQGNPGHVHSMLHWANQNCSRDKCVINKRSPHHTINVFLHSSPTVLTEVHHQTSDGHTVNPWILTCLPPPSTSTLPALQLQPSTINSQPQGRPTLSAHLSPQCHSNPASYPALHQGYVV